MEYYARKTGLDVSCHNSAYDGDATLNADADLVHDSGSAGHTRIKQRSDMRKSHVKFKDYYKAMEVVLQKTYLKAFILFG